MREISFYLMLIYSNIILNDIINLKDETHKLKKATKYWIICHNKFEVNRFIEEYLK